MKRYPFVIYGFSYWKRRLDSKVSLFLVEGSVIASTFFISYYHKGYARFFLKKGRVNTRFSSLRLHHKPTFLGETILLLVAAPNAQNFALQ